ncbi:MAG TPA: SatD family protein [Bacteroidales bacterium]
MAVYSVLTGDIIDSSKLNDLQRKILLEQMKQLFDELSAKDSNLKIDIFRGDSFQGVQTNIDIALLTSLKIKAGLKRSSLAKTGIDTRIAIGIGEISMFSEKIQESDGEAFRNSGQMLDKLKGQESTLMFKSPWNEVNDEIDVHCFTLDAITGRWSPQMAEVVFELLDGYKQVQIASKLGITQPSVNQRIKLANWSAIEKVLQRFEKIMRSKI